MGGSCWRRAGVCERTPQQSQSLRSCCEKRECSHLTFAKKAIKIMFTVFETRRCDILCCYRRKKVFSRSASRKPQSSLYYTVQAQAQGSREVKEVTVDIKHIVILEHVLCMLFIDHEYISVIFVMRNGH